MAKLLLRLVISEGVSSLHDVMKCTDTTWLDSLCLSRNMWKVQQSVRFNERERESECFKALLLINNDASLLQWSPAIYRQCLNAAMSFTSLSLHCVCVCACACTHTRSIGLHYVIVIREIGTEMQLPACRRISERSEKLNQFA